MDFLKRLSIAASFFIASQSFAIDELSEGPHIFAGLGLNSTLYESTTRSANFGLGSNFKADIVWDLTRSLAFEWSSNVKFNKVDENLIWDTLLTVGLRYRLPWDFFHMQDTYLRVFTGRSPTVVYLDDEDLLTQNAPATRIQFDGYVGGLGLGNLFQTSSGRVWFVEGFMTYQYLRKIAGVYNDGAVAHVVSTNILHDHSRLYGICLSAGVLIF